MEFTKPELDAIIAGLRYLAEGHQQAGGLPDHITNIMCDVGDHSGLTPEEIHTLADAFAMMEPYVPTPRYYVFYYGYPILTPGPAPGSRSTESQSFATMKEADLAIEELLRAYPAMDSQKFLVKEIFD